MTPAYEMYEQLSFTIHVINLSDSLLFLFRVALISLPSSLFTRISVTHRPVLFCKLRNPHDTPTFKTEALHLVSNVQLVKRLLPRNEQQIPRNLAPLWQ